MIQKLLQLRSSESGFNLGARVYGRGNAWGLEQGLRATESGFSGLVVSMLASSTQVHGFKP